MSKSGEDRSKPKRGFSYIMTLKVNDESESKITPYEGEF